MKGPQMASFAKKFTRVYNAMMQPLCEELNMPETAVDILMYFANNPEHNTARDVCRFKYLKSGIVSFHIDRMVNEAKEHEAEDKKRREIVDAKNELDSFIFSAEKSVKDYGDKLQASDVEALNKAIEEAKSKKDSDDLDTLKAAKEQLMNASHKIAEVMYAQANQQGAGAAPGAASNAGSAKKDDDVIDAEFEDQN